MTNRAAALLAKLTDRMTYVGETWTPACGRVGRKELHYSRGPLAALRELRELGLVEVELDRGSDTHRGWTTRGTAYYARKVPVAA